MRLVLLGTNGFLPTVAAQTACFLLPEPGILLDAGSGLYRLADHWHGPALDIYLSHAHGDHICGLHYLFGAIFKMQFAHADAPLTEATFPAIMKRTNAWFDAVRIHATPATLTKYRADSPTTVTGARCRARNRCGGVGRCPPLFWTLHERRWACVSTGRDIPWRT